MLPDEPTQPEPTEPAPEPIEEPQEEQGQEPAEEPGEGEQEQSAEEKPEDAKEGEQPAETQSKHKRAGGWQRKIERLEHERSLLLEQLQRQTPPAPAKPDKDKTPEEKAQEWIDRRVEEGIARREQERQAQAVQAEFQRRTAEVRARHPDFEEVIAAASDIPVSDALRESLLRSEHGPDIMYQLASNTAELVRIARLPPLDAAREVGRLEAKLASSTAGPPKPKPAFRPPAPPTHVNGNSASTRSLEDLPLAEYKRAMRSRR